MADTSKTVAKNTLYNVIGGVGVQLLTVVTGIFVARHFGAESFGKLTYAGTIVGYFALITEFGISTIAIKIVASSGEPHRYIFSYLSLRVSLSVLVLFLLWMLILWIDVPDATMWLLVVYGATIPAQIMRINWVFYAQQKMKIDNVLQVGEKLLYMVGLFGLVYFFSDILIVPVAMVISTFLSALFGWIYFVRASEEPILWKLDSEFIRKIVRQGWPIGVAGAALRSNSNVDTVFVNTYHGDEATGFYGAAYRLINAMIMAGTYFTNAIFPVSCKRYAESRHSLNNFVDFTGKLLVMVTVPSLVLLSVHSEGIIQLIFGSEYEGAVIPFRMLIWAAGLAIICRLFHNTLVACEQQHGFMRVILISAVFNLACNFALIPPYGLVGAAASTIATELLLLIMTYIVLNRSLHLKGLWKLLQVTTYAFGLSAVFILPVNIIGLSVMYVLGYLLVLVLMGQLGMREWQLLRVVIAR